MRIALAQINSTVGDIEGNTQRIVRFIERARRSGADLVVFPEMAVFGYPPKDLLLRQDLVQRNSDAIDDIASQCDGITALVGYVHPYFGGPGRGVMNSVAVCRDGAVGVRYHKMLLPTYDVFDEVRYFTPGTTPQTFPLSAQPQLGRGGLTICEDLWGDHQFKGRRIYGLDPVEQSVAAGAEVLFNLSASPYRAGIQQNREELYARRVRSCGVPLIYVNQVGGNDDLIFDGGSLAVDAQGRIVARAKAFAEDFLTVDLPLETAARIETYPDRIESIRLALGLGIRDYLDKCGFRALVIGLSGGIDSAVTAALAVEAVGADRVQGVALPSRYSSKHSVRDARQLASNLGIEFTVIPIEGAHQALEDAIAPAFAKLGAQGGGVAEENIQARIRGNILMAISNKSGGLLLTTGNKSELAVGYCTLYGDMCGGLAVLSDVPKTVVYDLARHINQTSANPRIPQSSIDKPPSAELRENQTDQDTLPPYETLDAILEQYVEQDLSVAQIVTLGFDRQIVQGVVSMVDRAEFKRKQAPIGLKVTSRAFGSGRRMPIAAKYQ